MVRLPILIALACLVAACKTGGSQQAEETPILVDPNSPAAPVAPGSGPPPAPGPPVGAATPPATQPATRPASQSASQSGILAEPLQPVRGGQRVLPPYRGPEPCKMALLGESPVAKACSDGGIRKATDLMQAFVKRARAEGFPFQCGDCHPDEDDYSKLSARADGDFRKLLFLARMPD